jgi:hypothetical protein
MYYRSSISDANNPPLYLTGQIEQGIYSFGSISQFRDILSYFSLKNYFFRSHNI